MSHVSNFVTLSHSASPFFARTRTFSAEPQKNCVCSFAAPLLPHFLLPDSKTKYTITMALCKAAFAALSLFAAVEGFTTPTVSRVSQPLRMAETLAESELGTIATENIRNIAGA